jgi:hypothetical protein
MKKIQLIIILSILTLINTSCSSDNDSDETQNDLGNFLKSRVYLNPSSGAPNYD